MQLEVNNQALWRFRHGKWVGPWLDLNISEGVILLFFSLGLSFKSPSGEMTESQPCRCVAAQDTVTKHVQGVECRIGLGGRNLSLGTLDTVLLRPESMCCGLEDS